MATREEADRRYASVDQLAEDVRSYLAGLPVRAQQDSFTYRAGKFVRRNRAAVAAASVVALSLVAGIAATTWQAGIARAERDRTRVALKKAERIGAFLSTALSYSDPSAAGATGNNRRDATINQMLDDVAPRVESELAGQPEARASLKSTIGSAYLAQTRTAEAERYLNDALAEQLRLYGEGHPETGRTLLALGNALNVKGDFDAAAETARRAISVFRGLRGEGASYADKQLAEALLLYGDVMWTKGDYAASESAYTECLSLASLPQVNDQTFANSARSGLGFVRYAQGRLEESAALQREAVAALREAPRARWRLAPALNFLGQVLMYQGKYDEALSVLAESEAVSREQWGENSFDFARSVLVQAYALCFRGDYDRARVTLDRAAGLVARNFPDDKVTEANLHDVRGMILTRTGRAREGEAETRRATQMYQSVLVKGANGITLSRLHWAESLSAQRRYGEAELILLDAYRDASEVQGAGHLRTRQAAGELVRLYEAWGRPDLAAQYRVRAVGP
jgi:eukaryotic-like serine/threonine-protein kinase